jgi:hypothetical protein
LHDKHADTMGNEPLDQSQSIDVAAVCALLDKQAITEVIYRFSRAADRGDMELMALSYHEGATDDHGAFAGPAEEFMEWCRKGWEAGVLVDSNHVVTNVLIELHGDAADVESYFLVHQTWKTRGELLDDILGGRYLDRFERREGEWRLVRRRCVYDWGRADQVKDNAWFRRLPGDYVLGTRDRTDLSYQDR